MSITCGASRRAGRAFTLVEVLAALMFMAIVIPVAVDGLRIASLAGEVGERKVIAARIADRVLNELIATGDWQKSSQKGTVREGLREYPWTVRLEPWNQGTLRLMTVQVFYPAQGKEYDVRLSTIVDTSLQ
jgi:type II secretory pathway pseudopilin PulG